LRQAEVVTLRIFGGLGMEQVAAVVGASKRTVEADWTVARAWLRRELAP
jgi:DNA-directed RNA polymerase specialized sigma24 family protein